MKERKMNPNSLKNLKPYKKGQTGNPKGSSKKAAQRVEARRNIEMIMADAVSNGQRHESFTPEVRKMYWEAIRSLSPRDFVKAAQDARLPMGALVDTKAARADYTEGSTRNTDRIERQIYGNRNSVDVSGKIDNGPLGINGIGFVFGGAEMNEEDEPRQD